MIYLAEFVLGFSLLQLLIAFINLLFSQPLIYSPTNSKKVSVLIPARNEEHNIGLILRDIQNQTYQNIDIIVFDDQSEDNTLSVIKSHMLYDDRIKLIQSNELPMGWLGKNYGCHCLASEAEGELLLFLDADVRLNADAIEKTIGYFDKYQLDLLSVFPTQITSSWGERLTIPIMNSILLSLLPLILIRKSNFASLSAANGQFMLFDAKTYKKLLPHEVMKSQKVEDIKIAQYYKKHNAKVACLTGTNSIKCRMYTNYDDAITGFSKNIISFFGNSVLIAGLYWLTTTFGILLVLYSLTHLASLIYLLAILLTRIVVSIISRQKITDSLLLYFPLQWVHGVILFKAILNKTKKQYQWKGRSIS